MEIKLFILQSIPRGRGVEVTNSVAIVKTKGNLATVS